MRIHCIPMYIDQFNYKVRGAIFKVHKKLGAGLLEKMYNKSLTCELEKSELSVSCKQGGKNQLLS